MMVALLLYAYARGIALLAGHRARLRRGRRLPRHRRQQRPDHATIARFVERHEARWPAVRRGARALRAPVASRGHRDRRHQAASQRQPRRQRRLRAARARDHRGGQSRRRRRGRALRRGARRRVAARVGHLAGASHVAARGPARADRRATSRPGRSRARGPRGEGSQAPPRRAAVHRVPRQRRLRGLPRARADAKRAAARPALAAQALHAARTPEGRINITDPDSHIVKGCAGSSRATTPRLSPTSTRSSSPPKSWSPPPTSAPRADAPRYSPRARGGRRHRRPRGGARRRRLLAPRTDERDHRPRHPAAHPTRLQPTQKRPTRLGGGAYAFHARAARERPRRRALRHASR